MATTDSHIPGHFFPNAAPELKSFLWDSSKSPQFSICDALTDYINAYVHSPLEWELADIIVEGLIKDWQTYQASDYIVAACILDKHKRTGPI